MSAYLVNREHIAYLLTAATSRALGISERRFYWSHNNHLHRLDPEDESRNRMIGQMLWNANNQSVNHRYNETDDAPRYAHQPHRGAIDPIQVIKACHCYQYQSNETPDWETSEAKAFIESLIHRATAALPGYDKAVWGAPACVSR